MLVEEKQGRFVRANKLADYHRIMCLRVINWPIVVSRKLRMLIQIPLVVVNAIGFVIGVKNGDFSSNRTKESGMNASFNKNRKIVRVSSENSRLKEMINLHKVLPQSTSHDLSVIAHGRFPIYAQRHVFVVRVNNVAHVFVRDILLRERKIFRFASYQEIACEIHLQNIRCQLINGSDAKR